MKSTRILIPFGWPTLAVLACVCGLAVACSEGGPEVGIDPPEAAKSRSSVADRPPPSEAEKAVGTDDPDADPPDAAIVLRGQSNVTIRGRKIRAELAVQLHDCDDITLIGCDLSRVSARGCRNLRIVNCYLHDSEGNAVYMDGCEGVLVQGNRIERVRTGVLVHRSRGVRIVGNLCQDVFGPMPGGQFVQFDKVAGPGNAITDNYAINRRDTSEPEDMISVYQSHGTSDSPILIENNYLVGDPEHGSAGKSGSGSGIMLGDDGGSWQLCRNNTLISPGQVGIGIASGQDIVVHGNLILGKSSDVANVGLYAWNQYENRPVGRVTIRGNTVAWVNKDGIDNPYWDGGGFTRVIEEDNTFGGQALLDEMATPSPPSILPQPPVPFEETDE